MQRRPHIKDHSDKKDRTEEHSVEHVKEKKTRGRCHKDEEQTRSAHASLIDEYCKSEPVDTAQEYYRKMKKKLHQGTVRVFGLFVCNEERDDA